MGYSYDSNHRLCCDFCGAAGGVRKYPCPFGYCPSAAACALCRKQHSTAFSKDYHRDMSCEAAHQRFVREHAEKAALLAQGEYLLAACSLLPRRHLVHVVFTPPRGVFMPLATYNQLWPKYSYPTLRMFEAIHGGPLPAAPADFCDPNSGSMLDQAILTGALPDAPLVPTAAQLAGRAGQHHIPLDEYEADKETA